MKSFIAALFGTTILCAPIFAQAPLPTGTGGEVLQIGPTIINPNIIGGTASGSPNGISPQVLTNAALQGSCTGFASLSCPAGRFTYSSGVWRVGVNTAGDAPALFFKPQNSACSTQFGDIGSCVPAADGTSFVAVVPAVGLDVREFGVKFDGTTDNSATLQASFNWALTNNFALTAPAGHASFGTGIAISLPNSAATFSVSGVGRNQTFFDFTGSSGSAFTVTYQSLLNATHWSDFTLTTNKNGNATGLALTSTVPTLSSANAGITTLNRLAFQGADGGFSSNFFSTAIPVTGVDQINFDDVWIAGSASFQGIGVSLTATSNACCAVQYNFQTPVFQTLSKGIYITSNFVQGIYINQASLTNTDNIYVDLAATNGVEGIGLVNSTTNGHNTFNAQGNISNIFIIGNNIFMDNTGTGILLPNDFGLTLIGNKFAPNNTGNGTGVNIGTSNTLDVSISENQFINLSNGIVIGANTGNVKTSNNSFLGTTTPITNNSTIGGNIIGSPATAQIGSLTNTIAAGATVGCTVGCSATAANVLMPFTGAQNGSIYFSDLWLFQSVAPGATHTNTYTWQCGGVSTNITTTISGASQTLATDETHNAIVPSGSECMLLAVIGGASTPATLQGSIRVGINP